MGGRARVSTDFTLAGSLKSRVGQFPRKTNENPAGVLDVIFFFDI